MGPRLSARRSPSHTPGRAATHSPVRRLDYSIDEPQPSVERSPRRAHDRAHGRAHERLSATGSARRRNVFDLPESPVKSSPARRRGSPLRNVVEANEDEVMVNGTHEESPLPPMGDEDMGFGQDEETQQMEESVKDSQAHSQPKKRGRPRKSDTTSSQVIDVDQSIAAEEPEVEEDAPAAKKRRGRPPKNHVEPEIIEPVEPEKQPTKRGRPAKNVIPATQSPAKSPAKSPARKPALAKKDANKPTGRPRAGTQVSNAEPRAGVQRQLHIDANDEDNEKMGRSRSGRLVVKPLNYWSGERKVFANIGGVMPVGADADVAEIVRVEDATPVKRAFSRRSASVQPPARQRRGGSRLKNVFEQDEDDGKPEPWEQDAKNGVVAGPVRLWDNVEEKTVDQEELDQQLAFAEARIKPQGTDDNPTFLFTKTLTMSFFGSGMIELQPGGFKGLKNSRRFQFVFFVHQGRVAVTVNGTRFVISKGGVFQVPRGKFMLDLCEGRIERVALLTEDTGNFYSIANESEHSAKLMFAQGCEPTMQVQQGAA